MRPASPEPQETMVRRALLPHPVAEALVVELCGAGSGVAIEGTVPHRKYPLKCWIDGFALQSEDTEHRFVHAE